jgi:diguanylate cyclase (GGDEF)-like protein
MIARPRIHQGESTRQLDDDAPIRALLVEDEFLQALAVQRLVSEATGGRAEVVIAERLQAALDLLGHESFDVVLLDLMLPDAGDLQGLNSIVQKAPRLPVVILTGLGHDELVQRAFDQGAQDYLVKGRGSGEDLLRSIRYAIRRKASELRRLELARADPLTGLVNRAVLIERLMRARQRADREQRRLGFLFLDLDGFKAVNDTMGHAAGDRLLQEVATRLRAVTRQVDTVARVGGDEFVLLAEGLHSPGDASVIARKALYNVRQPLDLEGQTFRIGASIGISVYPDDSTDLDVLMRLADEAMYRAKRSGRGRFAFASAGVSARIGSGMRRAVGA